MKEHVQKIKYKFSKKSKKKKNENSQFTAQLVNQMRIICCFGGPYTDKRQDKNNRFPLSHPVNHPPICMSKEREHNPST